MQLNTRFVPFLLPHASLSSVYVLSSCSSSIGRKCDLNNGNKVQDSWNLKSLARFTASSFSKVNAPSWEDCAPEKSSKTPSLSDIVWPSAGLQTSRAFFELLGLELDKSSAWTMYVRANTIANCFRHCKLRSTYNVAFENTNEHVGGESTQELRNLIKELGYHNAIEPPEEKVVAQSLTDEEIIESVIGTDEYDEGDDESSKMEPPSRNEAIKAAIMLINFLLSYEKTTPEILIVIRKIRDEIQGAFAAMAILGKIDQALAPKGISMTIAPLGAVCAVLFATPASPGARKFNMFVAQIGCAAIGVLAFSVFGPGWLARSAALSASIAFMISSRSVHPPAASLPLLFIDGVKLHKLNFWYALFPGAAGCILLCLI
ncbi:hypothetical protein OROMI_008315 [Orobanche minor]